MNPQFEKYHQNKNFEYQDIPINQNDYMNEIHRDMNQEYLQNNEDSLEENRNGENQRYYQNEIIQENYQNYNYPMNHDPNYQFNKNSQYQNMNQNYQKEDIQNQYNSRQSRFKDISNGQQQYLMEMQRNQELQNMQNNQPLSNSYYEMGVKNYRKQINPNMQQTNQYFGPNANQLMNNEAQMAFNSSYQTQNFNSQYGEVSFKKEQPIQTVNMISGSSTDRYANSRNLGLHNYMSAGGQVQNTNAPSSTGYNSQSTPGMPDSSPLQNSHLGMMSKEYVGNPPTFHPYHHLQNSSQINSQNSIQTPTHNSFIPSHLNNSKLVESQTRDSLQPSDPKSAQITPKIMASRFINYDAQMQASFQFPIQREDSREREKQIMAAKFQNSDQNSFNDRNQRR